MKPHADKSAQPLNPQRALYAGFALEGGLGVLAAVIAWLAGISLLDEIRLSARALAWGLAGALPMLAVLAVLTRVRWPPIARIREIVRDFARQSLLTASRLEVAILCALAGIGEELLFRGVIQSLVAGWTGPLWGILLSGVLFGAVHFITKTYFILAVAVGCYFSWLYVATGSLTVPIVAHAAYDYVALVFVLGGLRARSGTGGALTAPSWNCQERVRSQEWNARRASRRHTCTASVSRGSMLKATFEFVGGPKDGNILEGWLGEGDEIDRYYLFSNHGNIGQHFKVASDYAIETLLSQKLTVDSKYHFQPHYYRVTDRLEEEGEVWVRAEYVKQ